MRALIEHGVRIATRFLTLVVAVVLTVALFLVLPLIQAIANRPTETVALTEWNAVNQPPPPPPPQEEEVEEEEPEEPPPPPELNETPPPLDLSALSALLDPGAGFGAGGAYMDLGSRLESFAEGEAGSELFSLSDLDQEPRCTEQPPPVLTAKLRKRGPGKVNVIFVVDERGRVVNPKVQSSSDPIFERPALDAVKKWRFEPGRVGGEPVATRMRVPIVFPGEEG